ncbi:MAG: magnesium transporter [Candidatus Hydrogenedentes bacterium]|nr:magnesium transporter [Candidatus Hydrogenedentota bacterium]
MAEYPDHESWEQLEFIIERKDSEELTQFLDSLPPSEVARAMSRLDDDDQTSVLRMLAPEDAADLIEELPESQGADLLEDLSAHDAAKIVDEMDSDIRADVLSELDQHDAEAILQQMSPEEAEDARDLLRHAHNTAGGLMITEYLAYSEELRVQDVLADLRANAETYSDYAVQYVYVTASDEKLVGVIQLRDLVLSPGTTPLKTIAIPNPLSVPVEASLRELEEFFDRHAYFGVPVVDANGAMAGVVQRADVEEAQGEAAQRAFLRFSGIVGGEELRSMSLPSRAFRRLSFLTINIFLNVIAASVIVLFESTLAQVIALAAFLPIISDMSGCSGSQAIAVSIRELSLGLIKPRDFMRVCVQEILVGLPNGIVLGGVLGTMAYLWKGDPYLGLVVGTALAVNTVVGVTLGGAIPLVLNRLRMDPALAAAPILTTVTDMCGFFLSLSLAALALSFGKL